MEIITQRYRRETGKSAYKYNWFGKKIHNQDYIDWLEKQLTLTDVVKQSEQFFCDCGKNKPVIKEPAYVHCTWCEKTYIETK